MPDSTSSARDQSQEFSEASVAGSAETKRRQARSTGIGRTAEPSQSKRVRRNGSKEWRSMQPRGNITRIGPAGSDALTVVGGERHIMINLLLIKATRVLRSIMDSASAKVMVFG
jgi:hypothetical protein